MRRNTALLAAAALLVAGCGQKGGVHIVAARSKAGGGLASADVAQGLSPELQSGAGGPTAGSGGAAGSRTGAATGAANAAGPAGGVLGLGIDARPVRATQIRWRR